MKPLRSRTPFRKVTRQIPKESQESVKVFCRIKPLKNDNDISCLRVISPTTVQLVNRDAVSKGGIYKQINYTFQHIFFENNSQKTVFDSVALPLVENLIQGKNGLLFTYGVTGSGKTYTMNGELQDGGIMPRCINVIFNTISDYQARKYVFKPDRMNGFEVQSEIDASIERANSLNNLCMPRTPFREFKKRDIFPEVARIPDTTKVAGIDEDSTYAVFVTYIEIYNNYIYDLLECVPDERTRIFHTRENRVLRSDCNHNMYIHGIVELEVKTPEEALDALYRGQKRKRMAHTNLNSESSRSHSVFTIRLVQAPLDKGGESALHNKEAITVSQLSLVDLAGSERTNRTRNTGQRLKEAGNINNSLMTLRTCLEVLRENQVNGTNKMIPYRDSKLTLLFKTFFEGVGQVHVIVCVNPQAEDSDETVQVMKFAEMAQEVQVTKPPVMEKPILDLLPGRRRINQVFKEAIKTLDEKSGVKFPSEAAVGVMYSLGPPFPKIEIDAEDSQQVHSLTAYLETRMNKRIKLSHESAEKQKAFRSRLLEIEKENILSKEEKKHLEASLQHERRKTAALESRIFELESEICQLQGTIGEHQNRVTDLEQRIEEKNLLLSQQTHEKEKVKRTLTNKVAAETEKVSNEYNLRMRNREEEMKVQMQAQNEKLRKVREILECEAPRELSVKKSSADIHVASAGVLNAAVNKPEARNRGHRRSQSAGDVWLEHRSAVPAPLPTVLQPVMRKRRSVRQLTSVADITDPKVSKYCLTTQERDSEGEVETRLYKADVVSTTSGGAQIIFNDMESLRQRSPEAPSQRKRSASIVEPSPDVQRLCSVSIEGHAKKPRV